MKAVFEDDGTLFENALILIYSEDGTGKSHIHNDSPFMPVGRKGAFCAEKSNRLRGCKAVSGAYVQLSDDHAGPKAERSAWHDRCSCVSNFVEGGNLPLLSHVG